MNISRIHKALSSYENKTSSLRRPGINSSIFTGEFSSFFENLTFVERKVLKVLGDYDSLISIYDRIRTGSEISQQEIQALQQQFKKRVSFKNSLAASGINFESIEEDICFLDVTFPVVSGNSSIDAFANEVTWFFKGIEQSYSIFDSQDNKLTILNVENDWLSVTVQIDWKMLLVILFIIRDYQNNRNVSEQDQFTIDYLAERRIDDKLIEKIKTDLEKNDAEGMGILIAKLDDFAKSIKELNFAPDWKTNIRLLIKRVKEAMGRKYKIEAELPNLEHRLGDNIEPDKIDEVKKLIYYDRDIDDGKLNADPLKIENKKDENKKD